MKRFLLLSLTVLCVLGSALAQRTITGKVVDESGEPLFGANILIKGTMTGTVTGIDGNFTLSAESTDVLVVSYTGYTTRDILVGDRSELYLSMESGTLLGEVIVIGYGEQNSLEVTGSISKVKGDDIATLISPSFESQLAGRAAGLMVTTPSGIVGQRPIVRIRGVNSLTNSADPLFVIDGVPMVTTDRSVINDSNPLANINPQDIESYEVLKDGSATAIFGSRAANGVILITTKRGSEGTAKVSYSITVGTSTAASRFDLLNSSEFVTIANEKRTNANPDATVPAVGTSVDTDWQDYILVRGTQQQHNLSVSGGTAKTNYFFALNYSDHNGIIRPNGMSRYGFRGNLDHKVTSRIRLGSSLSYSFSEIKGHDYGPFGITTLMTRMLPNVPIFDPSNTAFNGYNVSADGRALGSNENLGTIDNNFPNLAYMLDHDISRTRVHRLLGNIFGEIDILKGLTARTQFGTDATMSDDFFMLNPNHGWGKGVNGYVFQQYAPATRWNWQNTLNLRRTFAGNHNLNVVAGAEYQKSVFYNFSATAQDFSDEFFTRKNLISGSFGDQQFAGGGITEIGFDSYFGRVNYDYKGNYLVALSVRNDGISSLHSSNRRGTFYGGSVGWRVSGMNFFNVPAIDDLKIRASYAKVGNVEIGAYPYAGGFGPVLYGTLASIALSRIDNKGLRWETSQKYNIGIDLIQAGFTFTLDVFRNEIDNLVLDAPVALSLGIPGNVITQNIGSMVNKGLEFTGSAKMIISSGFNWRTDFNITLMSNEVRNLVDPITIFIKRTEVGRSIGEFYVLDWAGVNPANGNPLYHKANGTIVQYNLNPGAAGWKLYNSSNPGNVSEDADAPGASDLVFAGGSLPTFMGGWNNTLSYQNFDLNFLVRFSGGNYIFNGSRQGLLHQGFSNNGREILDRWTESNPNGAVPKLYPGSEGFSNLSSTRFVEKGDFARIQNVTLGYNLPARTLAGFLNGEISNLRVYVQAQNLAVFTGYTGLDPELNQFENQLEFGSDWNVTPLARTFSVGLNVDF